MHQSNAMDPNAVRDLAYARWQARGCPEGSPEQDWLDAERELGSEPVSKVELVPRVIAAVASSPIESSPVSSSPVSSSPVATKEVSKRAKPPRPTLKREPVTTRGAKLVAQKPVAGKRAAG